MKDFAKDKLPTIAIVSFTVVLAGIAIFTAFRLYQLRREPIAPTAPTDSAASQPETVSCQALTFNIEVEGTPTPTPTGTFVPTATPTPTATSTPTSTSTPTPTPTGTFVPTATPTDTPRGGNDPTPTPTPTATPVTVSQATPTPTSAIIAQATPTQEQLPAAGIPYPTYILISATVLILIFTLILAL